MALRFLSLIAFVTLLPGARAADVAGTWRGAFDFQGSSIPLTINLKIDGAMVTGTVEGLPTTPTEIHDGTLSGDTVAFWVNTDYEGQTYKLVYKGKVADDQISFDFGTEDGSWSSPLMVKKSTDAAAAPAPPPAPDVTGDWSGTFDLNGTPMALKFHLKGSSGIVTGTVERPGAPPTEVHEGKIDGDTVSFWITTDYEGQTYTIVYKGKITAGQIDFDFGTADQSWSSQLTAKKS
jgi:riboflavin synthase alpha subunit